MNGHPALTPGGRRSTPFIDNEVTMNRTPMLDADPARWNHLALPFGFLVCNYCRDRIAQVWDHVIPRSRGGADTPANKVPACRPCNESKGARTPAEWGRWLVERARVMATICPKCGRGPGESCVSTGQYRPPRERQLHPDRRLAAGLPRLSPVPRGPVAP